MLKRTTLMAGLVGALIAFAASPVAQADVYLADPEKLEPGAEITLTSSDLKTSLPQGSLQCSKVSFHFEVIINGPEHVVLGKVGGGESDNEATTESCGLTIPGFGTFPATLTDFTIDSLVTIDTWGTAKVGFDFKSDIAPLGLGPCPLGGNVHWEATTTTDKFTVNPSKLSGSGGGGCSTEGSIAGSLTMETEDTTPVYIHSEETT